MGILDFIYPKKCLECKKEGFYICKDCLNKVEKPFQSGHFISFWKYQGVIRKAILALKFNFASDISAELSQLLYNQILKNKFSFDRNCIFTSIPLYKKRQNFRGFNQSEKIAKSLAEKLNRRFVPNLLIRVKNTKFQSELSKKDRKENLKNAFEFNKKYRIKHKNIQIVVFDDVWTTGSTIKEAIKVLRKQSLNNIVVLTLAR